MRLDEGAADLHIHTTASDGTSTVKERVEQAKNAGLKAIAITDHDGISDTLKEPVEEMSEVEVVTGVEVKADVFDTKIEILGYYVNPENETLDTVLKEVRGYREERNREMVERFVSVTGIDISYEGMRERAGGQVGRPDFARLLVEEGLVDSVQEAFDEYLAEDGDIYVPTKRVDYRRVVDAIHDAGGVSSLAHPGRIDSDRVPETVEEMSEYGLDGIEVWYPYGKTSRDYESEVGVERAIDLAEEHGLLRTGGSDCHGKGSDKFRIGDVRVPEKDLDKLRSASKEK